MDEDFYIEDSPKLKIFLTIIFLILLGIGSYYCYNNLYKPNYIRLKKVNVELGTKLSYDIKDYIECDDYSKYKLDLSSVKVNNNNETISVGEYSYKIIGNNNTKKGKVYVKDTIKPEATTIDLTVGLKEKFDVTEFVTSCSDLSNPCIIKYKNIKDEELINNAGEYNITILISDSENNVLEKNVKLIVKDNYSRENEKASDLNYSSLSNNDSNWNNTYTIKLDKALFEDSDDFDGILKELSAIEYNFEKTVKNKEIILVYNKYNYVIGISIKVTFNDDTYIFVTDENVLKEKNEEDE